VSQTTLLVLARCAGFFFRAPGFSHPSVPPMLRAALAFVFSFVLASSLRALPTLDLARFSLALASEVAIGAAVGFGASLLYDGAYAAGRLLDDYVGIRGSVPTAHVTAAAGFGRLWSSVFLAGFFLLDGWAIVVQTFAQSFSSVPPGTLIAVQAWSTYAFLLPATIVRAALMMAAPAVVVAAIVQLTLGAIARVVPRFSSFTLAFPIVFGATILVTIATVPLLAPLAARPWMLAPLGVK